MTTYSATATGNWSTMTWSPVGTPGSGDTVDCAGYTVTIDQDVNLGAGSLVATNAGSGGFSVTAARNITANVTATVRRLLIVSHGTGTVTVTGNLTGGSGGDAIYKSGAGGALTITGSVTGGAGWPGLSIAHASGVVTVTGAVTGGSATTGHGIDNTVAATLNVTGNVIGGSTSAVYGIRNNSTGTVSVTGQVTGGAGATTYGAANNAGGSLTVTEAIGNAFGPGSAVANSVAGVYGSATAGAVTRVKRATAGAFGQFPTAGAVKILSDATNSHTWKDSAGGADIVLVP